MSSVDTFVDPIPHRERAGLVDRAAARLVFPKLETLEGGLLTVSLPDGSTRRFGKPGALDVWIRVQRWRVIRRLLLQGDLGAGEAFLDGDWEADDLVRLLRLFARNLAKLDHDTPFNKASAFASLLVHKLRRNTLSGSRKNIAAHYDLGNEFYRLFLDEGMTYSCAFFESGSDSLEAAQERKIRRIAELGRLRAGQTVLEIGCGWGGFALHAARDLGCRVVGLTLSREQENWARRRVQEEGLSDRIEIRLADYRSLNARDGRFDRIVSIEMIEAVGHEFLGDYFGKLDEMLADDGLAVLQAITIPDARHDRSLVRPDFIKKHVFPGAHLPSLTSMSHALAARTELVIHTLEEIGPHYAETLRRWRERFLKNKSAASALGLPERFLRLWNYYLAYCEAAYAERIVHDIQLVLTRPGNRTLGPLPGYAGLR